MNLADGEVHVINGNTLNVVFNRQQVAAIRMIVLDEIKRHDDEIAKLIEQGIVDGLDPYDRG